MIKKQKVSRRKKIIWIILGSLLLIIVAARIALPYILLKWVNRELTKIPDYKGHVDDLNVALIRGAYQIIDLKLDKISGKVPVPFFSAKQIDLSLEWSALFHGRVVGKIIVDSGTLNFVKGPTKETSQTKIDRKWQDVVSDLMPLKLNRFEINQSEIHFRDFHSSPKVNIFAKNVHILAENLSNVKRKKELLPSTAEATADVYGGRASLHMKLDALNDVPTFEAKAELVSLDITHLNDFLEAYAKLSVKQGKISIYTEAAAKDKKIIGYTKPIIKDLKVVNWEKDKDQPLKLAWEAVAGAVAWVFKNHPKDQLATKAEFEGDIKKPDVSIWFIIEEVLENAFVKALYPSLENSISINSLEKKKLPISPLGKEYENGPFKTKENKQNEDKTKKDKNKKDKKKDDKKKDTQEEGGHGQNAKITHLDTLFTGNARLVSNAPRMTDKPEGISRHLFVFPLLRCSP